MQSARARPRKFLISARNNFVVPYFVEQTFERVNVCACVVLSEATTLFRCCWSRHAQIAGMSYKGLAS